MPIIFEVEADCQWDDLRSSKCDLFPCGASVIGMKSEHFQLAYILAAVATNTDGLSGRRF